MKTGKLYFIFPLFATHYSLTYLKQQLVVCTTRMGLLILGEVTMKLKVTSGMYILVIIYLISLIMLLSEIMVVNKNGPKKATLFNVLASNT